MFRFMQRFGRDRQAKWRGAEPSKCVRRRNHPLNCEALESRQLLSGYYLINAASGKVLDDPAFSNANGTSIIQYQFNGGTNQQWNLVMLPDGNYQIVNAFSGKVLDNPAFFPFSNGNPIEQEPLNGGATQQWILVAAANAPVVNNFVENVFSGKVLDDPDFSTSNGTLIIQFQLNGGLNQQWTLAPV